MQRFLQTEGSISKKIQIGYAKIFANRGKYRRVLAKLCSNFCDHSVLYA